MLTGSRLGPRSLWFMLIAVAIIALDQYTKALALRHLLGTPPLELASFLHLVLVFNRGAAFGFLSTAGGWQGTFFVILAIAVSAAIVIAVWRARHDNLQYVIALSLILGGAVGNVIDRIRFGYVIDFIDVFWRDWHWPAFNVADSAITVGAILFVMDSLGWRLFGRRGR